MAVSQYLQTKVTLTAQDRGVSVLLNKLSGEADATIDSFSRLGNAMAGILGGISSGYAIKKTFEWIDDYKMSVLSIATTLTDTMRNSGLDIDDVFKTNKKHAEDFFRFLQKQSSNSLASLDELMEAYTMLASFGRSLTPNDQSAKLLANVVDRIKLATRGQNQQIQVLQELRALMNGQSRPSDSLARILKNGNVNFQDELQKLIAGGASGNQILEFINKAFANIDIYPELAKNMSSATKKLTSNIKLWAINSFEDIYNESSSFIARIASDIDPNSGSSMLKTVLNNISSSVHQVIASIKDSIDYVLQMINSSFLGEKGLGRFVSISKTMAEIIPRLTVMLTTVNLITKAFSALKAVVAATFRTMNYTLTGQITALAALYMTIEDFAKNRKPLSFFNDEMTISTATEQVGNPNVSPEKKQESWDYLIAYGIGTWDSMRSMIAAIVVKSSEIVSLIVQGVSYTFTFLTGNLLNYISDFFDDISGNILKAIGLGVQYTIDSIVAIAKKVYVDIDNFMIEVSKIFDISSEKLVSIINDIAQKISSKLGFDKFSSIVGLIPSLFEATQKYRNIKKYGSVEGEKTQRTMGLEDVVYPINTELGKNVYNFLANLSGEKENDRDETRQQFDPYLKQYGEMLMYASDKSFEQAFKEVGNTSLEDLIQSFYNEMADKREAEYQSFIEQQRKLNSEKVQEALSATTSHNQIQVGKTLDVKNSAEIKNILDSIKNLEKLEKVIDDMDQIILKESPGATEYSQRLAEIDMTLKNLSEKINGSETASKLLDESTRKLIEEFNVSRNIIDELRLTIKSTDSNTKEHIDAVNRLNEENVRLSEINISLRESLNKNTEAVKKKANEKLKETNSSYNIERMFNSAMLKLSNAGGISDAIASGILQYSKNSGTLDNIYAAVSSIKESSSNTGSLSFGQSFMAWAKSSLKDLFNAIKEVTMETIDHLKNATSDALYNLITEGKVKISEVMESLFKSITRSLTDAIADMLVNQAVSLIGGSILGGVFAADGGIFGGGIVPIKAFARGGIATRPTIGLVGEAGQNEAVVPLPDGRTIPVTMNGYYGKNNVTVNIIDNSGNDTDKKVENRTLEDGSTVIDIIIDAVTRNRNGIRSAMRSTLGIA